MANDVFTQGYSEQSTFRGSTLSMDATRGFFQGRQFRGFLEFSGAAVIRFTSTKGFLLTAQSLYCDVGAARAAISTGSTPAGTFAAIADQPVAKNRLAGVPSVTNVTLSTGGTVTGGTVREILRASAGSSGAGLPTAQSGIRALPAGTYDISISVTGTTSGLYVLEWEELDS